MSLVDLITKYWAQILFFGGLLIALIKLISYFIEAIKCSLRNDILFLYTQATERGKIITRYELEAIKHSSNIYFKLHGNSFVAELCRRIDSYEIKD